MKELVCTRVWLMTGVNPERVLSALLNQMEQNGHVIVSVSVVQHGEGPDRYQAFVVSRYEA